MAESNCFRNYSAMEWEFNNVRSYNGGFLLPVRIRK